MEIVIKSKAHGVRVIYYDDADHDLVKEIKWYVDKGDDDVFYAKGRVKKRHRKEGVPIIARMHRLLMGVSDGSIQVDHIDHNGLNNRRGNLRIATQPQNSGNMRVAKDSTTGYKGVTYKKKKDLYVTRIRVNSKLIHGQSTKNIYEAALRYNELAIKYFGEFACLNELTDEQKELAKIKIPAKRVTAKNNTGYRGVCRSRSKKNPFAATIYIDGKNVNLGCHATAEIAAKIYNIAVVKYNKPAEWLNKIPNE